jgi:sulfate permease, SulP family
LAFSFSAFRPKLLDAVAPAAGGYSAARFSADVGAGVSVAIVALPLAMAFAMASGLKPEAGLFTAIIAGFLISLLGGSRVLVGGPAGAFIVIVYGIVERYGVANLIIATAMSGVMLFALGFFKLGVLIRFVPVAVVIGFTNGIAVLIALSQVKDFLGLHIDKMPGNFFGILNAIGSHLHTLNGHALALGSTTLALLVFWQFGLPRFGAGKVVGVLRRIPGAIVALVASTLGAVLLGLQVETIGSKFGGIPTALPAFALPSFNWETVRFLFVPAATLAALGAIESLLCARVADQQMGPANLPGLPPGSADRHDPNQELMAQGIANLVTPFFGGMPATGTVARTMTNVRSGATSPVAGIAHAVVLLGIMLVAAPLARHVPLTGLAAILLFVAWNMGEWNKFAELKQFRLPYRATLVAVFLLTVILDLTVAVEVGLVAACLTFIYRISSLSRCEPITADGSVAETTAGASGWPDGVEAHRLHGALFFAAVKPIEQLADHLPTRALVLDLGPLIYMDSSGAEALQDLLRACRSRGVRLYLCGMQAQPLDILQRTGLTEALASANTGGVLPNLTAALAELAAAKAGTESSPP